MPMIVVKENEAELLGDRALKEMFEARKRVFVDLLKWNVPVVQGRYEVDQFDNIHATYLIVGDRDGHHLGSARLLRTDRPHILDTLFPELSAGEIPRGKGVLEITRFCLGRKQPAGDRLVTRNRLVTAIVAHALSRGVTTYTGVAEVGWLQQILAFGWRCRPLGLPRNVGGSMLGALRIDLDEESPALLARNGIWAAEMVTHAHALAA
jgi:acyl-homoserine lactone synthase